MISYPVRIADQQVNHKLRELIDNINGQSAAISANASVIAAIAPPLTLAQIQQAIQLGGSNPVNITGLPGVLASPQAAAIIGMHAQRLTTAPTLGTFFVETDRTVLYAAESVAGVVKWVYVAGLMATTFGNQPVDLGTADAGFELWITIQNHILRWSGAGWAFLDSAGGYIADFVVAPPSTGWQLCDGTATDYLAISGATIVATAFTTPDETTGNPGTYHKSAAAYTGAINAPTAPVFSGTPASLTASSTTPTFSGTPGTTGNDGDVGSNALLNMAGPLLALNPHTHSFTPAGTVSTPTITVAAYTPAGTNDTSGQPKNLGVLRYFRR